MAVTPVDLGVTRGDAKAGLGAAVGDPVALAVGEGEAPLGEVLGVGLAWLLPESELHPAVQTASNATATRNENLRMVIHPNACYQDS